MDLTVFLAVLAAAAMHASWNVMVKLKLDRFLSLFLIQSLMGVMGLAMLAVFASPARASWPYALTSGLLHTGYNLFLARSYRTGDLSQVYPIARGTAPLLTLIVTWFAAHERIGAWGAIGIGILVAGIWLVGLAGPPPWPPRSVRASRIRPGPARAPHSARCRDRRWPQSRRRFPYS